MRSAMQNLGHLCFRGQIYWRKVPNTQTYVPFTDPQTYIEMWLKSPVVGPKIVDHDHRLKAHLSTTDNTIADEVVFDYDLVEVRLIHVSTVSISHVRGYKIPAERNNVIQY